MSLRAKIHYPTYFSVLGYSQNTEKMSPSAAECDFTTYFQSAKPFAVYTETQLEQCLEIDAFIIDAARVNHTLASMCVYKSRFSLEGTPRHALAINSINTALGTSQRRVFLY